MNRKGFIVMLGVILINTILAILGCCAWNCNKKQNVIIKIFIQRKWTSYEKISE